MQISIGPRFELVMLLLLSASVISVYCGNASESSSVNVLAEERDFTSISLGILMLSGVVHLQPKQQ